MFTTMLLCFFSALAGFIDAVSGGGGLIQLPALFNLRPDLPHMTLLGTNKLSSVAGTLTATANYLRKVPINWLLLAPAIGFAFAGSRIGAQSTSLLSPDHARPLMLVLLVLIAVYTMVKPDLGTIHRPMPQGWRAPVAMGLIGGAVGFYDGFFGPGTGSLLAFLFVGVMGFDFLEATTNAKVVNATTNLAALSVFLNGHVVLGLGLAMGACNILGGYIGSHSALKHGARFVRVVFLVVMVVLIGKFGFDIFVAE